MDEKGDDAIGMDDEATEPKKTHEDVKSVDKKGDEVADMPAKQSNLGKTVTDNKLSDRPAEWTSLQERLAVFIVKLNYPKLQNKNGHCCKSKLDKVAKVVYRLSGTV